MKRRALLRRAFPYMVIGIGGFALAYVLVYLFVLPSKIVPAAAKPYVPDSSRILRPIDTTVTKPERDSTPVPDIAQAPIAMPAPAPPQPPVGLPDLVGMALPDARGVLNDLHLRIIVDRDTSSLQPPNTVIRQSPTGPIQMPQNGTVTVTVSYFPSDTSQNAIRQNAIRDTTHDSMAVQHGAKLPPIMPAEPYPTRPKNPEP